MKNKSAYILFNESEIDAFNALDNESLGHVIHCVCNQFLGTEKEDILSRVKEPFQRAFISQILDGQEIRKQEYLKKCEQNRQSILKRWEKNHPGEACPYVDDQEDAPATMYSIELVEDAFREAAAANKLNLKYIKAILHNWQNEKQQTKVTNSKTDPNSGYSQFVKH